MGVSRLGGALHKRENIGDVLVNPEVLRDVKPAFESLSAHRAAENQKHQQQRKRRVAAAQICHEANMASWEPLSTRKKAFPRSLDSGDWH
jgi:hypothetical protein